MPLVKAGRVTADPFLRVSDDAAIPQGAAVLVTAQRFLAERDALAKHNAPLGVIWPNNRRTEELAPYLAQLALIGLVFPTFRDGRAYSQARQLRERHGFRGELRATGQVLRDQFLFLSRAGFDAFEVIKEADAAAFAQSITRYSVFYQPTEDGRPPAFRRRVSMGSGLVAPLREKVA